MKSKEEIEDKIYSILDECEVQGIESEWTDKGKAAVLVAGYILESTAQYKADNDRLREALEEINARKYDVDYPTGYYYIKKIAINALKHTTS